MTDFLDIPTFLRRGHPDCVAAMERGRQLLKESPDLFKPKPRKKESFSISPKVRKVSDGRAGSKAKVTRETREKNDRLRASLTDHGYSKTVVAGLQITRVQQVLDDIAAGKGAPREDQL